jgi:hypothetical protein
MVKKQAGPEGALPVFDKISTGSNLKNRILAQGHGGPRRDRAKRLF